MFVRSLIALVALVPPFACADDILPIRNHRSIALVFLRPVPLGPITQSTETRWQFSIANEMRDLGTVYEDGETWRISFFHRQSLSDHSEWFVEVPYIHRGGGILDPIIDWWHRVFVDDGDPPRNITPYGLTQIDLPGGNYASADGIGDITAGIGQDLNWATARLWIKLPTGNHNGLLGSGNLDAAVSLDRAWSLSPKWKLSAHGGLTAQGRPSELEGARGLVESAALAVAYRSNSRDTWLIQWSSEASPTQVNPDLINAPHRLVSLGFTRQSGDSEFSVSFMQDGDFGWFNFPGGARIGPDWTLVFGFTTRR